MKKLTVTLCLTLTILLGIGGCQTTSLVSYSGVSGGKLPPCKGNPQKQSGSYPLWTMCNGSYQLSNGENYVGAIIGGKPDGLGTITFSAPHEFTGQKQDGEFFDGKFIKGTVTHSAPNRLAGVKKVGEFEGGSLVKGTMTFVTPRKFAGQKWVGKFREGKLHGQGTLTFSAPSPYAGDEYVGEFKYGKYHGQGTYTKSDGSVSKAIWENNKWMRQL
jgi:hypothetical protein